LTSGPGSTGGTPTDLTTGTPDTATPFLPFTGLRTVELMGIGFAAVALGVVSTLAGRRTRNPIG
jgi:hypothetical protein